MIETLYQWIRNISIYLVLTTVILHALPDTHYTSYIRFYMGLVLMILVLMPVLHVLNAKTSFDSLYQTREYKAYLREVEEVKSYFNELEASEAGETPE